MKKELLEEIRRELEELKKRNEFDQEHISKLINEYIEEISEKDSYNIYMYMGSFRVGKNGKLFFEDRNSTTYDYRLYRNLEQNHDKKVKRENVEFFEKTNTVLIPEDYSKNYSYEEEYANKQREFILLSLKTSQENAKKSMIRSYKKKS